LIRIERRYPDDGDSHDQQGRKNLDDVEAALAAPTAQGRN
jgi:hypothetical protein